MKSFEVHQEALPASLDNIQLLAPAFTNICSFGRDFQVQIVQRLDACFGKMHFPDHG